MPWGPCMQQSCSLELLMPLLCNLWFQWKDLFPIERGRQECILLYHLQFAFAQVAIEWVPMKFIWYIFFMYFTILYFTFYGMMTTAITPNHNVAAVMAAPFYMLWNVFSGFMIAHKVQQGMEFMLLLPCPLLIVSTWMERIVEMVLLGKSHSLEFVWPCDIPIR